jgi:hypothetical protein
MTTDQAAIIVRESIKQAALKCCCKPSDAHRPTQSNKPGIVARNLAIWLAREQAIPVHFLAAAFALSRDTVQKTLRMAVAN